MTRTFITRMAVAAVAGIFALGLMAQSRPHGRHMDPAARAAFIAGYLELTDSQKAQAKEIFGSARNEFEQGRGQMQSAREALETAVKSNASDAQIEQAAAAVGAIHTQRIASMSKRFAKFWNILTDEQKEKAAALREKWEERLRSAIGRP